jgi:hypothetical protein
VGTTTTLTSVTTPAPAGSWVVVSGTGFGPNVTFEVDGLPAEHAPSGANTAVHLPAALTQGQNHPVVALNPEGCRSQESLSVFVTAPAATGCGLLGIEPFAALALLRALRASRRRSQGRSTAPRAGGLG